jgi:hypothetical protein
MVLTLSYLSRGKPKQPILAAVRFIFRDMSPEMANFVWEIASVGEMVILPAMENFVPVLTSPAQKEHLPSDVSRDNPEPVVCESPGEFASWRVLRVAEI